MIFLPTDISDVYLVETNRYEDSRGYFYRGFCDQELAGILKGRLVRQANVSCTNKVGSIRGMHFQYPPHAEMKMIRCLSGAVWDAVVDLRQGSPTFLEWRAFRLDTVNSIMLVVPQGCAHGFQTILPDSQLLYLHTDYYAAECEGGIRYNDPRVNIGWPLPVSEVSDRDKGHPLLEDNFQGLTL